MAKRVRYDSVRKFESSEESDDTNGCNQSEGSSDPDIDIQKYQSNRKPKCFSRNAEMARQNRLKKKIHLAKLEKKVEILKKEKNDLTNIIDRQSTMLCDLKKEVRYLKGVIANSSDIRTLIKSIHTATGMPVSSSLNSSLKVCTVSTNKEYGDYSLHNGDSMVKEEPLLSQSSCISFDHFGDDLGSDHLFDVDTDLYSYMETSETEQKLEEPQQISPSFEHNYTSKLLENENYGICLHVCKNKVSLEFCSSCEENARRYSS